MITNNNIWIENFKSTAIDFFENKYQEYFRINGEYPTHSQLWDDPSMIKHAKIGWYGWFDREVNGVLHSNIIQQVVWSLDFPISVAYKIGITEAKKTKNQNLKNQYAYISYTDTRLRSVFNGFMKKKIGK